MGFITVLKILNDGLSAIETDPNFGKNVSDASRNYGYSKSRYDCVIAARGKYNHGNCAEVISVAHADNPQFTVMWHNSGWKITYDPDDGVPEELIKELRWILRERSKRAKQKTI